MAGYIKVEVDKFETQYVNTRIDARMLEEFQKKCKERNIPMNVIIETFARQYIKNRYILDEENILKWKGNTGKFSRLNTPINKDVFDRFKWKVKLDEYSMKCVLSAFIEDYAKNDLILEFIQN